MAKKKTIDLRSVEPTPVPAGDVNIIYNGTRIGGFSEDTDATLKTGGTRVEHDIYIRYTKPAGQTIGNVLNVQNNASNTKGVDSSNEYGQFIIVNNELAPLSIGAHASGSAILLSYKNQTDDKYYVTLTVPSKTDVLNVTVNDSPVTHDGGYTFTSEASDSPIAGQTYNVVITDKE